MERHTAFKIQFILTASTQEAQEELNVETLLAAIIQKSQTLMPLKHHRVLILAG
jgi:hypothetical protein